MRRWLIQKLGGLWLGERDAAYVWRTDGSHEVAMPLMRNDEEITTDSPAFQLLIATLLFGSHDPRFIKLRTKATSLTRSEAYGRGLERRRDAR